MKKVLFIFAFMLFTMNIMAQSQIIFAGDNVCLRLRPNESSKWTGSSAPHFFTGQKLSCAGVVGNYYKVVYDGEYYYVPKQYARPRGSGSSSSTKTQSTSFDYIIIAGDNVCFRTRPDESTKLVGSRYDHVNTGDVLQCVGQTSGYYKVRYNGSYYYIPKKYGRPRY
ncbi:MAG: hypothetical protein IKZ61_11685 [Prevotella sp.]|nr:hypothetical protein [Prevotella sp.]